MVAAGEGGAQRITDSPLNTHLVTRSSLQIVVSNLAQVSLAHVVCIQVDSPLDLHLHGFESE